MKRTGLIGAIAAFLTTTILIAFPAPVFADGPAGKGRIKGDAAAASADAVTWTGFHMGGSVGYGFTRSEFETFGGGEGKLNVEDMLATVGVGWDLQVSSMVFGLMADVTVRDFSDTRWQWFVGGRGGVLFTPKTLVYGLVGYTEDLDGDLKLTTATSIKDIAGLTLGGGLEHVFGQGWAARAEYRYVSFGRERAPNGVADGLADGSPIDTGEHQARVGVVKRF